MPVSHAESVTSLVPHKFSAGKLRAPSECPSFAANAFVIFAPVKADRHEGADSEQLEAHSRQSVWIQRSPEFSRRSWRQNPCVAMCKISGAFAALSVALVACAPVTTLASGKSD